MDSISNFFTNIGQGASELFNGGSQNSVPGNYRPPISGYRPPPGVSPNQQGAPGQIIYGRPGAGAPYQSPGPGHGPGPIPGHGSGPIPGHGSGPIPGLMNPVNQFSKAIEEITRNDDFQCIPKVICEMVGSQRRQPGILGSPIFSS